MRLAEKKGGARLNKWTSSFQKYCGGSIIPFPASSPLLASEHFNRSFAYRNITTVSSRMDLASKFCTGTDVKNQEKGKPVDFFSRLILPMAPF